MDRISIVMARAALAWLVLGVIVGALMLVDRVVPGDWRAWMSPSHGHMLFVGWFLQFALGIAYWLLPRKRNPALPLGYRETPGLAAVAALNLGLVCRVIAEPFERTGHASGLTLALLVASAILQVVAVVLFVAQLWPRIYGRNRLGKPAGAGGGR